MRATLDVRETFARRSGDDVERVRDVRGSSTDDARRPRDPRETFEKRCRTSDAHADGSSGDDDFCENNS